MIANTAPMDKTIRLNKNSSLGTTNFWQSLTGYVCMILNRVACLVRINLNSTCVV